MSICSKKCIRGSSAFVLITLVALAISFLTLSFKAADNETLAVLGDSYDPNMHLGKQVQYCFIFISFAIIIIASFGVSAAFSGDHCMTYIFGYFSFLMFLTFGAVGVSMSIMSSRVSADFDKECLANTGIAYNIDQIYTEGSNIMCTKQCPCDITDKANFPDMKDSKFISTDGYKRYLECPVESMSDKHKMKFAPLLRTLEAQFNCAGICSKPKFFLFSDINKGAPTQICKDFAISHIKAHTGTYTGFILLASLVGLIGVLFSVSICYHKNNKLQFSWEKYQKMKF